MEKKDRNFAVIWCRVLYRMRIADICLTISEDVEKMSINISCNRNSKACIIRAKQKKLHSKNVQPCQAASDSIYKLQFIRFKNRGFIYERKI